MNANERIKMVKAMEFLVRQVNNEEFIGPWLDYGVADGDIEYGDLEVHEEDAENLEYYISDEEFSELMNLFLRIMKAAHADGGLYCDGIVSK